MSKKILICGLPGSGKTTLAKKLAPLLKAVHLDGDTVRALFNDKGFSRYDRTIQAYRMNALCQPIIRAGYTVVASFICPTAAARAAFKADFTICMVRKPMKHYLDTDEMWEQPDADVYSHGTIPEALAALIMERTEL